MLIKVLLTFNFLCPIIKILLDKFPKAILVKDVSTFTIQLTEKEKDNEY